MHQIAEAGEIKSEFERQLDQQRKENEGKQLEDEERKEREQRLVALRQQEELDKEVARRLSDDQETPNADRGEIYADQGLNQGSPGGSRGLPGGAKSFPGRTTSGQSRGKENRVNVTSNIVKGRGPMDAFLGPGPSNKTCAIPSNSISSSSINTPLSPFTKPLKQE